MSRAVAFPVSFEALLRAIHAIMSLDAIAITNGTLQAVCIPKAHTGPGSWGVVPRSGTMTVHAARLARTSCPMIREVMWVGFHYFRARGVVRLATSKVAVDVGCYLTSL